LKRETMLQIALRYLATVTELSDAELRGYLSSWKMAPYFYRGELCGCGLLRDNEIHFMLRPEHTHRALQRNAIHAFLAPLVLKHGGLVTRVHLHDRSAQRFVARIGFVETHRSGTFIFYSLIENRFKT
jgi:hypothetical protein